MRVDSNSDTRSSGAKTPVSPAELADELAATRRRTLALVEPLSEELLARQVRDFMSPLIWDLGHIASFEQLWLLDTLGGHRAGLDERFDFSRRQSPGWSIPMSLSMVGFRCRLR